METQSLISGALLAQVVIGIVMFGASIIIQSSQPRTAIFRGEPSFIGFGTELLILVLATIAILVFTTEMSASWAVLFKSQGFVGIPRNVSMPTVFVIDILITARLVHRTGGSIDSPFQPIFFLIPTLALLLYEPSIRIAFYAFLVSAVFVALIASRPSHIALRPAIRMAYAFVSLSSLGLAVAIGLLTRTCPSDIC